MSDPSTPQTHTPESSSPPPDEMDRLMRSSPIPPSDDDEPSGVSNANEGMGHSTDDSPSGSTSQANGTEQEVQISGVSRNESIALRRVAEKLKLHPYQRTAVQDLLKCNPVSRDGQLMMSVMAVDNKLDLLIAASPPFSINGPLHLNIKSFIIAVLLSAKLAAYKGSIPRDHVLALVLRDRLHLPTTFDRDPHASKLLKEHVNHELSQARGKLKKIIKAGNDKNIFDLATLLVNGTSCTVTVPLCGRVALFRKVFEDVPGDNFWKAVDDELKKIRGKAAGNPVKVNRYFTAILKADQETYRGDSLAPYTIPTTVTPTDGWQLEVDNLIGGAAAA